MAEFFSNEFPSPCGVRRVKDFLLNVYHSRGGNVSVPLRGKEGEGRQLLSGMIRFLEPSFPSPCGVRRVKDSVIKTELGEDRLKVSVPLRGKEGEGLQVGNLVGVAVLFVSVPLRGKEGEGPNSSVSQSICRC